MYKIEVKINACEKIPASKKWFEMFLAGHFIAFLTPSGTGFSRTRSLSPQSLSYVVVVAHDNAHPVQLRA